MKVKIKIVGTEGQRQETVDVDATGASVEEVCRRAGIDPKDKDLTVNGKAAQLDTHVGKDDVLGAQNRPAVTVSARPQGS